MNSKRRPKNSKKRFSRLLFALKVLAVLALVGVAALMGTLWYFSRGLPSVDVLSDYQPPQTTLVLDRHGDTIGEIFTERRTVIPMSKIPRVLVLSVIAAEDADFYQHDGFDYQSIVRALARDLFAGRRAQGASTITQQTVKLMLLTPERTISRKLRELILARRLEQKLSKDEILNLYLNHINFGHGRYGVQEAARYYFGKDADKLTLAEASLIAGVPQSPRRLSPRSHPEAARRRQLYVLGQLESKREVYWPDLSQQAIEEAREADVEIQDRAPSTNLAPEVVSLARQALRDHAGQDALTEGGYRVHTTIDLKAQLEARDALRKGLEAVDKRQKYQGPSNAKKSRRKAPDTKILRFGRTYPATIVSADDDKLEIKLSIGEHEVVLRMKDVNRYNPDELKPSEFATPAHTLPVSMVQLPTDKSLGVVRLERGPQGAVVALDARSRDVLALVGHYEKSSGFNRALLAIRQPGSTFKPLVYALGIRSRRFTAASLMLDAPAVYDEWKPQNYEKWNFQGAVRLREALAQSINMVAVRMIEEIDPKNVIEFAKSLGITTDLEPNLALALGASGVKPVELVNAYATFAAGGRWAPTKIITKIEGPEGLVSLPKPARSHEALTASEAYIVSSILQSVVDRGTGARAKKLGRAVAGKTGTSNNARDAWFVGFSPTIVSGVWVGFDDHRPLGGGESGPRTALPIWIDVMERIDKTPKETTFAKPNDIVTVSIDPASGLLAYENQIDSIDEVFLNGTAPTEQARPPDVADPSLFLIEQIEGEESEEHGDVPPP